MNELLAGYLEEQLKANYVHFEGPFPYFGSEIRRISMSDNNGRNFYCYIVHSRDQSLRKISEIRSGIQIIRTAADLARDTQKRLASVEAKYKRKINDLENRIEGLEKSNAWAPRERFASFLAAAIIVAILGTLIWLVLNGSIQFDQKFVTFMIYGLIGAATAEIFRGYVLPKLPKGMFGSS
ncbi:MAG: hypothetical protein Q8Q62_14215 [Mesorhizobium sp.]|nr:hypothetical protein [Mesorhizobium sp.]